LSNITICGTVITGEGNGKKYIQLPWVKQQIENMLGFSPYYGTLNLQLTVEYAEKRKRLAQSKAIMINPAEGYCVGHLFRSNIGNLECAVILPQFEGYPENILEIVASVNLRETLKLKDGDAVTVTVLG